MTTLEKIRADIENQLFIGRILNSKDFDLGMKWCLALVDKYAEQEPCDKCEVGNPCLYCKHEFEQEPKTGHWVEIDEEPHEVWECDHCGFVIDGSECIDPYDYRDTYKFCPNCGAKMVEPQESEGI